MYPTPSKSEILTRIANLHAALTAQTPDEWCAFIVDKVNQYYFTGTIQDGVFILKSNGDFAYCVRNSLERAKAESLLPAAMIHPMTSYKNAAEIVGWAGGVALIETEAMPVAMLERLKKYFVIDTVRSLDRAILNIRAVKSLYELACMEESGRIHKIFLEEKVPALLREGVNEAELTGEMFAEMIRLGYHGVSRFSMFQTLCVIGQLGFGENSLYPTNFDGPGGMRGMCPAVPLIGDRSRTLRKGDLVFIDVAFGWGGYHTDRTQIYMFGAEPSAEVHRVHRECVAVQKALAAALKPGAIPCELYDNSGFVNRNVRFLGHGVGLYIDEYPVITSGFDSPLQENMTIALEPKRGFPGVGLLGAEDTYVVTKDGGRCLTGGEKDIITVC
jgi:Xaa-Pro aminopeptidase